MDRRGEILASVANEMAEAACRKYLGSEAVALIEHERDPRTGMLTGYTERYLPVIMDCPDALAGSFARVRLEEVSPSGIIASVLESRR